MLCVRVIPVVLYDGTQAVKTVRFQAPRNVGHVAHIARLYASRQVDEIVFLDIAARKIGLGPDLTVVEQFARETNAPFAAGGGIRSLDDARALLDAGADKVVMGVGAWGDGDLLEQLSARHGAQAVVATLDVHAVTVERPDPACWAARLAHMLEGRGAGELLLTSVPREGMRDGYDTLLIRAVASAVHIPVIANGGMGRPAHAVDAVRAGAHAVAGASMFLFSDHRPRDVKAALREAGYEVRI